MLEAVEEVEEETRMSCRDVFVMEFKQTQHVAMNNIAGHLIDYVILATKEANHPGIYITVFSSDGFVWELNFSIPNNATKALPRKQHTMVQQILTHSIQISCTAHKLLRIFDLVTLSETYASPNFGRLMQEQMLLKEAEVLLK